MNDFEVSYMCFHGTVDVYAKKIQQNKKFEIVKRKDHWLGNGAYFFVNDSQAADWWAKQSVQKYSRHNSGKRKGTKKVLSCKVCVLKSLLLDLDTQADQCKFQNFKTDLEKKRISVILNKEKDEHVLTCLLLDLLVAMEEYKATKYTFTVNNYRIIDERYKLRVNGVQLCVFDQNVIDFESIREVSS
ncbi:MAG: hypothetical protein ABF778_06855 [Liquorilactobacillus hordei]|uniref:hypothetical protein n=1 Tax=Liquorilactobacillus hordei TaxID=468911 RepID=UPI0039ECCEB9